jgi:uncharacterized protein YerC
MSKPKTDKNIQIPDHILKELLTESEWRMLKNRWQIVNLLEEGMTIRRVAEEVKVGTDTVVRVSKMISSGELRKITTKERKLKSRTPWIFGKSE